MVAAVWMLNVKVGGAVETQTKLCDASSEQILSGIVVVIMMLCHRCASCGYEIRHAAHAAVNASRVSSRHDRSMH